jgi:hypothetical protein
VQRLSTAALRYVAAGVAGSAVFAVLAWPHRDPFTTLLIAVLPIGVVFAASVVSTTAGVREANHDLSAAIRELNDRAREHEEAGRAAERELRNRLRDLLHGPVQGRLAACAMALNFSAAGEPADDGVRESLIAAVTSHLDAVASDLRELR